MPDMDTDIVIAGGGPAGASCATFLARAGHDVLLLEREVFPRYMIGESLLPALWDLWDALGVTEQIEAVGYPVKQGVRFRLDERNEYLVRTNEFPEYFQRPSALHVDREHFDQILLDNARAAGAEVREGCCVTDAIFEGERAVGLRYTDADGAEQEVRARVVVDATGRRTLLASKLGWRYNNPALKKASYYTLFDGAGRQPIDGDGCSVVTDIEVTEGGWIWYIPLRGELVSVGVVLDSEYVKSHPGDPEAQYAEALAGSSRISEWLSKATRAMPLQRLSAVSYLSDDLVGDGFLLVGDAGLFVDPIFSAGVTLAIRGAQFAAEAIDAALAADDTSAARLRVYEERFRKPLDNIVKMILNWYEILDSPDRAHFFELSRRLPMLRERLVVLLSGGYEKIDLDALVAEATPQ